MMRLPSSVDDLQRSHPGWDLLRTAEPIIMGCIHRYRRALRGGGKSRMVLHVLKG
jgi:hypothetical protein